MPWNNQGGGDQGGPWGSGGGGNGNGSDGRCCRDGDLHHTRVPMPGRPPRTPGGAGRTVEGLRTDLPWTEPMKYITITLVYEYTEYTRQ